MRARWTYFSWFGTLKHSADSGKDQFQEEKEGRVDIPTTLDELEGILIMAADPLLNRQGAKFKKELEYTQVSARPGEPVDVNELQAQFEELKKHIDGKLRNLK